MAPHSIKWELTSDEYHDHVCITHIDAYLTKRQTMNFFLYSLPKLLFVTKRVIPDKSHK